MSKRQDDERVRTSQVLAGALAAVTAALIGSTMGVAGTVVGAGLASVISTVGGAVYLRSIQRTRDGVRTVRAKVVGRSGGATVLVSTDDPEPAPEPGDEVEAESAPESASEDEQAEDRPSTEKRRLRWPVIVVTTVAAFALGMVAVTGVEWLRGESLSGGSGTTFGSVVAPHGSSSDTDEKTGETTSTTTPTTTTTTPTDPTTTTAPTTTSTTPPSESTTTTTTTTTPPVTTTTEATPPGGSIPSGN
jgi:hypothetical protein